MTCIFFFVQAEDGIRDLVRSRGLGDVYKRQVYTNSPETLRAASQLADKHGVPFVLHVSETRAEDCLLYTSDAADERSSVDLGGRRIIKKKNPTKTGGGALYTSTHTPERRDGMTLQKKARE